LDRYPCIYGGAPKNKNEQPIILNNNALITKMEMKYKCSRYNELDGRTHTIGPYKDGEDPRIAEIYNKTGPYVKRGRGNCKAQKDRHYAKYRDVIGKEKS
jgi:hypothetical protein